ncbi:MAG: BolA family protein [Rhizobiaceae bacterium]
MSSKGPLVTRLEQKMQKAFAPQSLEIINESHLHAGHQPGFNGEGESHIRVRMIADHFNGMSRVNIHREINAICADEIAAGLHALAIDVKGTE